MLYSFLPIPFVGLGVVRDEARKIFWGGMKVLSKSCQYEKKNYLVKKKITPYQGDIMNLTTQL